MKKKIWISIVVGLLVFQPIWSVIGGSFSSSVTFPNSGSKKYKGIRLTPKILNIANPYHSDLLLLNQKNEMVPYFINRFKEDKTQISKTYEMKLINSFVKVPDFFYDYSLLNPIKGDMQATSIEVTTFNDNFVKNVTVYGSFDNINWETVHKDIIYSVDKTEKLVLNFDETKKYTYYRFQLNNPTEKIFFQTVQLKFDQQLQSNEYFLETMTPGFSIQNEGSLTILKIQDLKNLTLFDITIETTDMFKRFVSYTGSGKSKELYNLSFKNNQYRNLTIPLEGYSESKDFGFLTIENQDDKPIQIKKVVIRRYVEELVFDGSKATSFILKFGNPAITEPPTYDVASYKENIIQEGYDLLPVGEIKTDIPLPSPPPSKPKNYQWLFNLIIIAVAILIGYVLLVRIKKE